MLLVKLQFSETQMRVVAGAAGEEVCLHICSLWEHTVYELEQLSNALRVAALGLLVPIEVPANEVLIGDKVRLWTALQVEVGHPGIGKTGRGVMFYCSTKDLGALKRRLVHVGALYPGWGQYAVIEVDDALRLSDVLFDQARTLSKQLIR